MLRYALHGVHLRQPRKKALYIWKRLLQDLKDDTDQCEGNGKLTKKHFAAPPPPLPREADICDRNIGNRTDAEWWEMLTECRTDVVGRDRFIETIRGEWKDITRKELKAYVQLLFKTHSSDQLLDRHIVSNVMNAYWQVTHGRSTL